MIHNSGITGLHDPDTNVNTIDKSNGTKIMTTRLGSDLLLKTDRITGKRVGIVANPASLNASFHHIADRIHNQHGTTLVALFGPQHGFNSDVQDNMIETDHDVDQARGVPVFSLYSDTKKPLKNMLADLDLLVIDLQDVGTRVYTYVYTMANCLKACRDSGLPVIVCDRPNPISGIEVEGPLLDQAYTSFVGQFPIPMRHGMTIGELALLFNEHFNIGAQLEVIPMKNWERSMYYDATGLPWIMPSPNIPTLDTAIVYPGSVLFEGTALSEGRGTTRPFEILGAPWVSAERCAERANSTDLPGVYFRPLVFVPTFHKHQNNTCGGCQIHITDRKRFRAVESAVNLMIAFREESISDFVWREPPYEYEHTKTPIDILAGSALLRSQIEASISIHEIAESWKSSIEKFLQIRARHLLY